MIGSAVVMVSALYRIFNFIGDRAFRIAFGQHLDETVERALIALIEHALDGLHAHRGFAHWIDRSPAGRQSQFKTEGSRDLRVETVERADAEAM